MDLLDICVMTQGPSCLKCDPTSSESVYHREWQSTIDENLQANVLKVAKITKPI
jgi:hypothetical protein